MNCIAETKDSHPARSLLFVLGLALLAPPALARPPVAFDARFELLRNGKPLGESRFRFTVDGDRWRLSTETKGTRGLARFLGLEETSESHGTWVNDAPRPQHFSQTVDVSFRTVETRAEFDWAAGSVTSVHKDGTSVLDLEPGVLDPVSIGLKLRSELSTGAREWRFTVLDEDELEEQVYRVAEQTSLDTVLGCFETHRVDRVRRPDSTRYTRTWYAQDLAWVPVKVAHGKTDGNRMESRLVSLVVDGEAVSARPPCD